jgi:hypothetical protein
MAIDPRIERALHTASPVLSLRDFAAELLRSGQDRDAVYNLFESARAALREADREADEDAVMDVMDFLTGWCSPHMKL